MARIVIRTDARDVYRSKLYLPHVTEGNGYFDVKNKLKGKKTKKKRENVWSWGRKMCIENYYLMLVHRTLTSAWNSGNYWNRDTDVVGIQFLRDAKARVFHPDIPHTHVPMRIKISSSQTKALVSLSHARVSFPFSLSLRWWSRRISFG